jgi:diamine N-acetyltransferase
MSANPSRKAYSKPQENLDGCQLTSPITQEQALAIGATLAVSEPWLSLKFSATALANYLMRDDPALRRYAVSIEGQLAGVICIRTPWLRGPYIELLGLFPDARGKGIGKQLLHWAESEARRESKNLWVIASSFNQQALSLYEGFGFTRVGTIPGLVLAEQDEILLRKRFS